jgi:hypothetical protein
MMRKLIAALLLAFAASAGRGQTPLAEMWKAASAASAAPAWTPLNLPGCIVWLDAQAISATNGQLINVWSDLSGYGNAASNSTADQNPRYFTSVWGSKPSLSFDGTNDTLYLPGLGLHNSNLSVFVVCSHSGFETADMYYEILITFRYHDTGLWLAYYCSVYKRRMEVWNNTSPLLTPDGGYVAPFGPSVFSLVKQLGTSLTFYDGTNVMASSTGAGQTAAYTEAAKVQIGYVDSGLYSALRWHGHIGEIIIYSTALSTNNHTQLVSYLKTKWGL